MMFSSCGNKEQRDAEAEPTAANPGWLSYVLAAVDELVYGHHAVFVLVHLLLETEDRTVKDTVGSPPLTWKEDVSGTPAWKKTSTC